jgi:hypothetical protein
MVGWVTLKQALKQMSSRSGLRIEAAPCLQDRKIFCCLYRVAPSQALDAICSMAGLTWRRRDERSYIVSRPRVVRVPDRRLLKEAVLRTLPPDLAAYLDFAPRAPSDLARAARVFSTGMSQGERQRLQELLAPVLARGEVIPYVKLTNEQRADVILTLVSPLLCALGESFSFTDHPSMCDITEDMAVLRMSRFGSPAVEELMITGNGDPDHGGTRGFGASITQVEYPLSKPP